MITCYANALGNCSKKISNEHYISKGIIEFAQDDLGRILLEGKSRACSAKKLASKRMLCTTHNSQLSKIDAEMLRFVKAVFDWNNTRKPLSESFDGSLITRWLFKYGTGIIIAENLSRKTNDFMFEKEWLEVLFGLQPLPVWCGFEVSGPTKGLTEKKFENGVPPWITSLLISADDRILGAQIGLYPIEIFGTFGPSISQKSESFRLSEITLEADNGLKSASLSFKWPKPSAKAMKINCRDFKP